MTNYLSDIEQEVYQQREKWGVQNHDPHRWLAILMEEVGEVARALCDARIKKDSRLLDDYREELIQVAAVAVAALDSFDRNPGRDTHNCTQL